jgi:hypothetical protein
MCGVKIVDECIFESGGVHMSLIVNTAKGTVEGTRRRTGCVAGNSPLQAARLGSSL